MTVNELYRNFLSELSFIHSRDEAANITSIIFEYFTGIDKSSLIKDPHKILGKEKMAAINDSLASLKKNKPVQYITGEAWFYKMKLKVSPAVLIPRPETETLVEALLASLKYKTNPGIIDIGTGSGCIAIAIKKNNPSAILTAIDISPAALNIAKENASSEIADIHFLQVDFLSKETWNILGNYDVIVSNPPYIPSNELVEMNKNVTEYEPHIALFVDDHQPLVFYENIAEFGKTHLKEKGIIFLETHEDFANEVCKLFENSEFYSAIIKRDMFDKQRFVIATRYQKQ